MRLASWFSNITLTCCPINMCCLKWDGNGSKGPSVVKTHVSPASSRTEKDSISVMLLSWTSITEPCTVPRESLLLPHAVKRMAPANMIARRTPLAILVMAGPSIRGRTSRPKRPHEALPSRGTWVLCNVATSFLWGALTRFYGAPKEQSTLSLLTRAPQWAGR